MPSTAAVAIGRLLTAYLQILSAGYGRTVGDVYWLLSMLATMELIMCMAWWAWVRQGGFAELTWKLFGFAFLFWLVETWPELQEWLKDSFIEEGLLIGASGISLNDIQNPGNLVDFGFNVTSVLFNNLAKVGFLEYSFMVFIGGLAGFLIVCIYIVLAACVFKAILEYAIVGACLLFLVPFLAFEKTAFIGERVFGTFVSHAVRLLLYAAILSVALPVIYTFNMGLNPRLEDVMMVFASSFIVFCLALSAPTLASGLIQGAPVLSFHSILHGAGSFAQTGLALGAVGAAVSVAGAGALRGGLSGLSAMREAAHMGQAAYRQSHPFTHASRRGRVETAIVGSAQGIGTYAVDRVVHGFRAAVAAGRARPHRPQP